MEGALARAALDHDADPGSHELLGGLRDQRHASFAGSGLASHADDHGGRDYDDAKECQVRRRTLHDLDRAIVDAPCTQGYPAAPSRGERRAFSCMSQSVRDRRDDRRVRGIAWGQERVHQQHDFDDPEGRLIGYYSAALLFSPLGTPERLRTWAFDVGLEIGYIPELSKEQRTAFQDKPEATNLAPVLPRPRVTLRLPGTVQTELSWVPPMQVFDVEANLFSVALSRPFEPTASPSRHGSLRRGARCAERSPATKT